MLHPSVRVAGSFSRLQQVTLLNCPIMVTPQSSAFAGVPLIVAAILPIIRQDFSKAETSSHCFEAALSLLQSCLIIVIAPQNNPKRWGHQCIQEERQSLEEED